eukprot:9522449-Lingulodinium_polyedra.AAC.1
MRCARWGSRGVDTVRPRRGRACKGRSKKNAGRCQDRYGDYLGPHAARFHRGPGPHDVARQ